MRSALFRTAKKSGSRLISINDRAAGATRQNCRAGEAASEEAARYERPRGGTRENRTSACVGRRPPTAKGSRQFNREPLVVGFWVVGRQRRRAEGRSRARRR